MIEKYVDAEELKRLLGKLAVLIGALMIAGLFATIVVPGLRNANKPGTQTPVNPVIGEPGWLNPAEYPPVKGKVIPAVDPQSLMQESPELLARGKTLFASNCIQCHGELGHGDGPGAASMNPAPRNFASQKGWTNGYDMPSVYKTLTEGIKGSSMTAFDYLSRKDRMALVHYVQSLGSFPDGAGSSEAMAGLSRELTSAGEKTPNKIPVSMAMDKIVSEYRAPAPFTIPADDSSEEAQILRRMIVDEGRAARTLASSNLWRSGLKELAAKLTLNAPGNGFSVDVATLSPSDWKVFQGAILKRLGKNAQER
jgi:mono/diheme cytochrome c family protein